MGNEKPPSRKVLFAKITGVLIALASAIGMGPSVVSKFHSTPLTISAEGGGVAVNGKMRDINNTNTTNTTNTTATNNYPQGGNGKTQTENDNKNLSPSGSNGSLAPSSNVNEKPEADALGVLVTNASLKDATWQPEVSRIKRSLGFRFYVEAITDGKKHGFVNVTLAREGKDICTISLDSATPWIAGNRREEASCIDTLPSDSAVIYRARIEASEMTPVVVKLIRVDAVKK